MWYCTCGSSAGGGTDGNGSTRFICAHLRRGFTSHGGRTGRNGIAGVTNARFAPSHLLRGSTSDDGGGFPEGNDDVGSFRFFDVLLLRRAILEGGVGVTDCSGGDGDGSTDRIGGGDGDESFRHVWVRFLRSANLDCCDTDNDGGSDGDRDPNFIGARLLRSGHLLGDRGGSGGKDAEADGGVDGSFFGWGPLRGAT